MNRKKQRSANSDDEDDDASSFVDDCLTDDSDADFMGSGGSNKRTTSKSSSSRSSKNKSVKNIIVDDEDDQDFIESQSSACRKAVRVNGKVEEPGVSEELVSGDDVDDDLKKVLELSKKEFQASIQNSSQPSGGYGVILPGKENKDPDRVDEQEVSSEKDPLDVEEVVVEEVHDDTEESCFEPVSEDEPSEDGFNPSDSEDDFVGASKKKKVKNNEPAKPSSKKPPVKKLAAPKPVKKTEVRIKTLPKKPAPASVKKTASIKSSALNSVSSKPAASTPHRPTLAPMVQSKGSVAALLSNKSVVRRRSVGLSKSRAPPPLHPQLHQND